MEIRAVKTTLSSITPYSQSGFFRSEKKKSETHDEFEKRCWREKMHATPDGFVFLPAMSVKYALDEAVKRMGVKTGQAGGKERYTKFFQSGVQVSHDVVTDVKAADVEPNRVMCSSTGKKGKEGGTRVPRLLPLIPKWTGTLDCLIFDPKIPEKVFEEALEYAGVFVGVGQFRPENQGYFGRFQCGEFAWGTA